MTDLDKNPTESTTSLDEKPKGVSPKKKNKGWRQKPSVQKLREIRLAYCMGIDSVSSICRKFDITRRWFDITAARLKWVRNPGLREVKPSKHIDPNAPPELKVDGKAIVYAGPLTEDEAKHIAQITQEMADKIMGRHQRLSHKLLYVANLLLDRLVLSKGMKEIIIKPRKGDPDQTPKIALVPAYAEIDSLAATLSKAIAIDRVAHGYDASKAVPPDTGSTDKAQNDKFVTDLRKEFEARSEAFAAFKTKPIKAINKK